MKSECPVSYRASHASRPSSAVYHAGFMTYHAMQNPGPSPLIPYNWNAIELVVGIRGLEASVLLYVKVNRASTKA